MGRSGHDNGDPYVVESCAAADGRAGGADPDDGLVDRIEVRVRPVPGWMRATGVLVAIVGLVIALGHVRSRDRPTPAGPSPSSSETAPPVVRLVSDNIFFSTKPEPRQVTVAFGLSNLGSGPIDVQSPQLDEAGLSATLYSTLPPTAGTAELEVPAAVLPPFTPLHMEAGSARVLLVRYQITDCTQALGTPATFSLQVNSDGLTTGQAVTLPTVNGQAWSIALAGLTCHEPN